MTNNTPKQPGVKHYARIHNEILKIMNFLENKEYSMFNFLRQKSEYINLSDPNFKGFSRRLLSLFICFTFFTSTILPPSIVFGQVLPTNTGTVNMYGQNSVLSLPVPGTMISMSDAYVPAIVKGVNLHPDDPLRFDFIIDKGNSGLEGDAFKKESTKLIKYFLAALTVPKDQMWVNLSPYEKDRIIPNEFGLTEMGRDLLAQDYMLKQLSSSLMYPEDELGAEFWERVYTKAMEQFGTTDIPLNTFNKIWIVPEECRRIRKCIKPMPTPVTLRCR